MLVHNWMSSEMMHITLSHYSWFWKIYFNLVCFLPCLTHIMLVLV